jgi:hypothetical protein
MNTKSSTGQSTQGVDNFYDAVSSSPPEYDNTVNQQTTLPMDPQEQAVREQEWRSELAKLEEEIATLRSVLDAKVVEASELKRKLGITPLVELKDDFKHGIQVFKESEPVQKTNAAFKSFGAFASRKFGDLRNSNMFKSVEEKVGGAYNSVKQSQSMGNIKSRLSHTMPSSRSAHDVNVGDDDIGDDVYGEIGNSHGMAGAD